MRHHSGPTKGAAGAQAKLEVTRVASVAGVIRLRVVPFSASTAGIAAPRDPTCGGPRAGRERLAPSLRRERFM